MSTLSQFADSVDKRFESIDMQLFRTENDMADMKQDIRGLKASTIIYS